MLLIYDYDYDGDDLETFQRHGRLGGLSRIFLKDARSLLKFVYQLGVARHWVSGFLFFFFVSSGVFGRHREARHGILFSFSFLDRGIYSIHFPKSIYFLVLLFRSIFNIFSFLFSLFTCFVNGHLAIVYCPIHTSCMLLIVCRIIDHWHSRNLDP